MESQRGGSVDHGKQAVGQRASSKAMRAPGAADALEEGALTIYVDGSMYGHPRRGGIGIRFAWLDEAGAEQVSDESLPSTPGATNNQMELEQLVAEGKARRTRAASQGRPYLYEAVSAEPSG